MPKIYIDAEYLLKELSFYADRPTKSAMKTIKGLAMRPDPDVVKVVRCKDCEWAEPYRTESGDVYIACGEFGVSALSDDDYCSFGERKETNR